MASFGGFGDHRAVEIVDAEGDSGVGVSEAVRPAAPRARRCACTRFGVPSRLFRSCRARAAWRSAADHPRGDSTAERVHHPGAAPGVPTPRADPRGAADGPWITSSRDGATPSAAGRTSRREFRDGTGFRGLRRPRPRAPPIAAASTTYNRTDQEYAKPSRVPAILVAIWIKPGSKTARPRSSRTISTASMAASRRLLFVARSPVVAAWRGLARARLGDELRWSFRYPRLRTAWR